MSLQSVFVFVIIVAAVAFALRTLLNKRKSFSPKAGCGDDCGCNGDSKKLTS